MVTRHRLSVEEYLALPEEKPYLEYVNGEVFEKPMPDWMHAAIVDELAAALREYRRARGGFSGPEGRVGFPPGEDVRFYLPDLLYFAPGRDYRHRPMPPPTLAVEVRSPGQSLTWLRDKCRFFRANGTDVCRLVDPEARTVELFDGEHDGATLRGDAVLTAAALPGFGLGLTGLFAVLDEE
ncbi:MAG: Uma2 family endonuclease [Dehalococcoidia bacterium]|nr:Uma2 family endonuclease [Dehalococcoidia bacterium]